LITIAVINVVLLNANVIQIPDVNTIISISPSLTYMALIAGFLAVLSWNIGNKTLGSNNAVLFIDVVPITAFAISAVQGSVPTNMQLIGAAITALALICNNIYLRLFKP
ncbi:MAG: EamA family transporter, partial [Chlorobiaceae bacterium]|nr:EamA family transporter [Chlorobiaceae bacterium]